MCVCVRVRVRVHVCLCVGGWVGVCVGAWKGGSSKPRLTGLDGTAPAEAYQTECILIYFYKGHSIDNLYFSGLQRSTKPVIASPQVSVPLIS